MLPLRGRLRKSADHREHSIDLVFELLAEADLARLVVVDFVVDLGDRTAMKSDVHRRARAARRTRTCSRYSSSVIVSAVPPSISAARRSISSSQAAAASASRSSSRLRINSSASFARCSAGSRRISVSASVTAMYPILADSFESRNVRSDTTRTAEADVSEFIIGSRLSGSRTWWPAAGRSRLQPREIPSCSSGPWFADVHAHAPSPGAPAPVLPHHPPLHTAPVLAPSRSSDQQRVPLLSDRRGEAVRDRHW